MVRGGDAAELDAWLSAARERELVSFAQSLTRDLAAVRAAMTEPWSTSPVEGQINRVKTVKRQMYGRAGHTLLRTRVLAWTQVIEGPLYRWVGIPLCTVSAADLAGISVGTQSRFPVSATAH
jgi:Transposase